MARRSAMPSSRPSASNRASFLRPSSHCRSSPSLGGAGVEASRECRHFPVPSPSFSEAAAAVGQAWIFSWAGAEGSRRREPAARAPRSTRSAEEREVAERSRFRSSFDLRSECAWEIRLEGFCRKRPVSTGPFDVGRGNALVTVRAVRAGSWERRSLRSSRSDAKESRAKLEKTRAWCPLRPGVKREFQAILARRRGRRLRST